MGTVSEQPPGTGSKAARILVVDDEEAIRLTVASMLQFAGYEVVGAAGGEEALDLFRREGAAVTAVILDLSLPGIDGEEVFRGLLEVRDELPVILSSGFDRCTALERFDLRKPAGFIQKPYRLTALLSELRRIIDA